MVVEYPFLDALNIIAGFLLGAVFITAGIICRIRLKSSRTREAHLVSLTLAMFVFRMFISVVLAVVVNRIFPQPLWMMAETSRFYASLNWWFGLTMELINSTFYAAAWIFILLAAFGPGSTSQPKFLNERSQP